MLQPGEMDQVVTLKRPTIVKDKFGQHTQWLVVANVAAKVEPLRGREFFAAGQTQNPASLRVVIYWRIDVQPAWRVQWMGRDYEVLGEPIDVDARHDVLEIMCKGVPA